MSVVSLLMCREHLLTSIHCSETVQKISGKCESDFELSHENKGFEGAVVVKGADGVDYLLGLCEGNNCRGGRAGRQSGHGKLVVLERTVDSKGNCFFKHVGILSLPRSCNFMDCAY